MRYHFLRDLTKEGTNELIYCHSKDQVVDILTKPLKSAAFVKLHGELGMYVKVVDYGSSTEGVSC